MDRISTYGASQLYISRIMQTQVRMQKEQLQSTTGYVTEDYSGIALDSRSAINLENSTSLADAFMSANASVQVRQNTANTALTAAQTSINTLKNRLISFASGQMKDQTAVRDVQDVAMRTLIELQSTLNTSVDGEYLFSGGRKDTMPVSFPVSKLADFQKMFDGSMTTFPTLRGADLLDTHLTNRDTGAVSFDASSGLIIPANAGAYAKVPSSSYVTISGTTKVVGGVTVSNDGGITIKGHAASNSGRTPLVETSNAGSGTFLTNSNGTVINNAATGALSFSYDKDGQMVVTPATGNSLTSMVPGTRFTISGSDAKIATTSATDTTKLVGTNFYTYNGNATSATGIQINDGDDLILSCNGTTYTYTADSSTTVATIVNWVNAQVDPTVPAPAPAIANATVDNQGRLTISNLNGTTAGVTGAPITIRGALSGVFGVGGVVSAGAGAVGTAGTPAVGTPLMTGVVAQTATSLGTPAIAVGDTLTVQVGAGAPATLTVTANTTLTDIAQFIQQQDPSTFNANGSLNNLGAQVSVSGGAMTVKNNNGTSSYTLGGNVATALGLTGSIANAATATGSVQPALKGNYDGSFVVTGYDILTGKVTIANDTTPSQAETLNATAVTLKRDTGADGIPDTLVPTGMTGGSATFTLSGDTVTMTLPTGGTDLTTVYSAGQPVTIGGTDNHNGTYQVSAVTANTISYKINTDMLRVGPFLDQSGRTDMTMTFPTQVKPLDNKDISPDVPGKIVSGTATLDRTVFGGLSFSNSAGTITSSVKGALLDSKNLPYPPVGTLVTLKGSSEVNAGVYEITGNDGTTLNIRCKTLKTETAMPQTEMTAQSWYKGDTLSLNTSINQTTTIDTSLTASDSAFEKVVRACGIIAQGAYGTAGGLDQHPERVEAAIALLKDALSHSSTATLPYGKEESSDLDGLQKKVGLNLTAIQNSNTALTQMKSFFVNRVSDIEQISSTEAITALLADSQALQTSYQALAKMQQMSLINFLK